MTWRLRTGKFLGQFWGQHLHRSKSTRTKASRVHDDINLRQARNAALGGVFKRGDSLIDKRDAPGDKLGMQPGEVCRRSKRKDLGSYEVSGLKNEDLGRKERERTVKDEPRPTPL